MRTVKPARPSHLDWRIIPTTGSTGAKSLRASFIKSVQAEGRAEYAVQKGATDGGELRMHSAPQRLSATLLTDGVRIDAAAEQAPGSAAFKLAHYGCANDSGPRLGPSRPVAQGNRVSYHRAQVDEWYQSGPLGVEQGFDLLSTPACRPGNREQSVELQIEIASNLHAALVKNQEGAEWLELRDDSGKEVLRYSDLYAEDADQKALPATMSLAGNLLTLRIDDSNARYPLHVDPLIWAQVNGAYKAGDAAANQLLGWSIAVSSDHAIIGAPGDAEGDLDAGAAFIFQLSNQGVWLQKAKIVCPMAGAQFGSSVAISNLTASEKRIAIGAPGAYSGDGLAYWLRGSGTVWTRDGEFSGSGALGSAVSVSGNRVAVGAPGEAASDGVVRIFEPDPTLSPPWAEAYVSAGPIGMQGQVGTAAAIDGDVAVFGAPHLPIAGADSGAAYIVERSPGVFTGPPGPWVMSPTGVIVPSAAAASDFFGSAVALQGLTAVIGAPGKSAAAGAAYIYTSLVGNWGPQASLHTVAGVSPSPGDQFGAALAVSGSSIVVGAPTTAVNGSAVAGKAYLFAGASGSSTTTWTLQGEITPKVAQDIEVFASSVAIESSTGHILAGAPGNDTSFAASGAFYDFILRKTNGTACAAASECASDFCVDGVCCDSACGNGNDGDCMACSTAKGAAFNGTCGTTQAGAAFVCRSAAGVCDQPETCDGTSTACPADGFLGASTVCRPAFGGCDVEERCVGNSASCPADAARPRQFECRAAVGPCDEPELCDGEGKACPADRLKPSLTICRLPSAECGGTEYCDGASSACPTVKAAADNTRCSAGSCQAGLCRTEADLGIAMAGPASVEPQKDLEFIVSVTNYGQSPVTNATVTLTLPADASLVSSLGAGVSCQSQSGGIVCSVASLGVAQTTLISVLIHPPGQAERMSLSAKVSSTVFDPNMANNNVALDQSLLSRRISGGGAGCAAVPGTPAELGGTAYFLALLALSALRRRRSA